MRDEFGGHRRSHGAPRWKNEIRSTNDEGSTKSKARKRPLLRISCLVLSSSFGFRAWSLSLIMSDFQYIARGLTGQQVDGVLSAGSEQEALASWPGRSLFPLHLTLAPEKASQRRKRTRRVRPKHLAITYSQLADLLRAGVPLLRSLELLEHKTTHSGLRNVLEAVRRRRRRGNAAGRSDAEASARLLRAGRQHGPGRRRGGLRRGRPEADRRLHRPPGDAQEPGHRRDGLPAFPHGDGDRRRHRHVDLFRPEIHADLRANVEQRESAGRHHVALGVERHAAAVRDRRAADGFRRRGVRHAVGPHGCTDGSGSTGCG